MLPVLESKLAVSRLAPTAFLRDVVRNPDIPCQLEFRSVQANSRLRGGGCGGREGGIQTKRSD